MRVVAVTGVQTCALPIWPPTAPSAPTSARVDGGADGAVGGRAAGLLCGLGEPALAQQAEGLVEIAGRLAERLLAILQPGPRLLPELLHEGEAHACVASASAPPAMARVATAPPLLAASGSCPAPRCRSS